MSAFRTAFLLVTSLFLLVGSHASAQGINSPIGKYYREFIPDNPNYNVCLYFRADGSFERFVNGIRDTEPGLWHLQGNTLYLKYNRFKTGPYRIYSEFNHAGHSEDNRYGNVSLDHIPM